MASNAASLSLMLLNQQHTLKVFFTHWVGKDAWEDAYQTLWLRLQAVRDDPPVKDMRAFLFYLAAHVAQDHWRGEARRRRLHRNIQDVIWGAGSSVPVDQDVFARDELARLVGAANALPEPTRTIFALNRMEQMTHREISERLSLSQNTVGKHVARALRILSEALDLPLQEPVPDSVPKA